MITDLHRLLAVKFIVITVKAEEVFAWSEYLNMILDETINYLVDCIFFVTNFLIEVKVDIGLVWNCSAQV